MNPSSTIIASSGVFQIEYLIETLEKDFDELISVSKSLKTILIELDINHPNYNKCINLIISNGFRRTNKFNLKSSKKDDFLNHVFIRY